MKQKFLLEKDLLPRALVNGLKKFLKDGAIASLIVTLDQCI